MTKADNKFPRKNAEVIIRTGVMKTDRAKQPTADELDKAARDMELGEEEDFFRPFSILRAVGAKSLGQIKIPTPERYWSNLISAGQLGMIFGWRGAGKSTFVLGLGVAMATGSKFLGYSPDRPVRTILLDGEMDLHTMQGRLRRVHESLGVGLTNRLKIVSPELFSGLMPRLSTPGGQMEIDKALGKEWEVLIVDNYSSFSSGREDADAWAPWNHWLLQHKRAGRTVILIHHTGKNGSQRGASNHEDAMDFVMALRHPKVLPTDDSLQFVVSWTKSRHLSPKRIKPFQVTFRKTEDERYEWSKSYDVDANPLLVKAKGLLAEGKKPFEIAKILNVHRSTVSRWFKD